MEMLLRFGQRGRFSSTEITYPLLIISWCQKQEQKKHRESSTASFDTMVCYTVVCNNIGSQYHSYSQVLVMMLFPTYLHIFEFLVLKSFIKDFFIPQINKSMVYRCQMLTFVYLLVCINLWFIMATIQCFQYHGFGAMSQLVPLRRIYATSVAYFLDTTSRKL